MCLNCQLLCYQVKLSDFPQDLSDPISQESRPGPLQLMLMDGSPRQGCQQGGLPGGCDGDSAPGRLGGGGAALDTPRLTGDHLLPASSRCLCLCLSDSPSSYGHGSCWLRAAPRPRLHSLSPQTSSRRAHAHKPRETRASAHQGTRLKPQGPGKRPRAGSHGQLSP